MFVVGPGEHLREAGDEAHRRLVGEHDVPRSVEHDAGIRVVGTEQALERGAHVL